VPITAAETGVAGGMGPWWIAPAALATVVPGQTLDADPVTEQHLTVDTVDEDAGTVTVAASLPGIASSSTYDQATGMLVGAWRSVEASGTTTVLQLVVGP
jgi:hypothetical protein